MLLQIYLWDPTFTPKLGHNYEHAGTTVQLPTASLLFSVLPEVHKDPSFSTSLPTLTIFCFVLCISFCDYLMLVMWMFSYTLLAICTSVEKHLKLCARFFFFISGCISFVAEFRNSIYILDIYPLLYIWYDNIFSHFVVSFFSYCSCTNMFSKFCHVTWVILLFPPTHYTSHLLA